jgi:hypothetical protein
MEPPWFFFPRTRPGVNHSVVDASVIRWTSYSGSSVGRRAANESALSSTAPARMRSTRSSAVSPSEAVRITSIARPPDPRVSANVSVRSATRAASTRPLPTGTVSAWAAAGSEKRSGARAMQSAARVERMGGGMDRAMEVA